MSLFFYIFMAFLIGLAVNLDNLLIGIHLGARRQQLTALQNLTVGALTGVCAFVSVWSARLISGNFLFYTNVIGSSIMIFFGIFCLYQSVTGQAVLPQIKEAPRTMDVLILGFVLAVNCIPPSLGAGVMRLSPWWVGFFSMLFSCLSLHVSARMGERLLASPFFSIISPLSAGLLISIGVLELLL